MSFWKNVSAPLLIVGLAAPALVNCDGLGDLGVPGADCSALKSGNFAELKLEGDAQVTSDFKGFLEAVYSYDQLALELETDLMAACAELGGALDMPAAELTAEAGGGDGAKKVCEAVAAKVKATLNAAGSASLNIEVGEPSCDVNVEAMMSCLEGCGAAVDPGQLDASCEGGEISGECTAECSGTCEIEGAAECGGTCEGTCEGKCDGEDSSGKCAGTCEGECKGTCKVEGKADCEGTCKGGCSGEIKAPKCSGEFKPPSVSVDCHARCAAKTAGDVECNPPSVNVTIEGEANADLEKLVAGLEVALPNIAKIGYNAGVRMKETGAQLVAKVQTLPDVATKLQGAAALQAASCAGMAVDMATSATASVSVSASVSADVSGSASGGT